MPQLPMEGIRVLDSTYVFALPYTGALLADFGAEVIKIEGPSHPDTTRNSGLAGSYPEHDLGDDPWNRPSTYNLLHRGKQSLTLDMTNPRGRDLFRDMVRVSDVVMENFTPRVMRAWELDYPNLRKIKPDIIMISNTGFGHGGGPYSNNPAQATTLEGMHGHCWVTGYDGEGPNRVGASFVDFLSTWTALFAIGSALRYRSRTGQGQWADIAMYQAGVMFMSDYLMDAISNGRDGERIGNRHPYRAPQGCYPAQGDNEWIALSVGADEQWQSLCKVLGREDLAQDARFADMLSRQRNHDELDKVIEVWSAERDKYDMMHQLQGAGIPAGPVLTGKDVHFDPQYKSRGFLERVEYPEDRGLGSRIFMGRPYKFSNTPLRIRGPAPTFGQDNERLLKELLGIQDDVYQGLVQDSITAEIPLAGNPVPRIPQERMVELGLMAAWDPEYRERLGFS